MLNQTQQPPVRAFHVIFCTYGFWLPNDPRGSGSDFVRSKELLPYGHATKVTTTKSVANKPHDPEVRALAKESLLYAPVIWNGQQAKIIGTAIKSVVQKCGYRVFACAILPDHVHLVMAKHHYKVEEMVKLLKGAATHALLEHELHPLVPHRTPAGRIPSPWQRDCWKVFLFNDQQILARIKYVNDNPLKKRLRRQQWSFVIPFIPGMSS